MISDLQSEFQGLPVTEFPSDPDPAASTPPQGPVAWRISVPTHEAPVAWPEAFDTFRAAVDPSTVQAIVVGSWADPYDEGSGPVVEALVAAAGEFPALRSLFLGDMTAEDCEISWIVQSDITALLTAFPRLEHLGVRGGNQLMLNPVRHENLRSLVIETGGLSADVVRAVAASELPALTDLELWLGTEEYGADSTVEDLAPILAGVNFPRLTGLALSNSEYQDDIAAAVAAAPIVPQLRALDLSKGVLLDAGAEALLAGQSLTHLESLDLHHNYLSDDMRERLRAALEPSGVQLNLDGEDAEEDEYDGTIYRSVAVGE
ncbi:leucine-rich repeat domain-containing protein [Rhodococcus sp. ABRD24]|uniref:STM4015 family protein n=1 Tax=Rhodococcus sp. ABRD24 TaxID=2507582 RepID=UPI00103B159A|nr:STM4015 family protein [Rhodococcus sp. ABRD24]QBJ96231.1 leucine-rich repeat domain-containing protein [Rhodococcus sp. ABRD24]